MDYIEFKLDPVDIGGGLVATQFWSSGSPIVLVLTKGLRGGRELRSRLDLQKQMFIDPVPGVPTREGISTLVDTVVSTSQLGAAST